MGRKSIVVFPRAESPGSADVRSEERVVGRPSGRTRAERALSGRDSTTRAIPDFRNFPGWEPGLGGCGALQGAPEPSAPSQGAIKNDPRCVRRVCEDTLDVTPWPMPVRLYGLLTWTTLRRLPLIHARVAAFLQRVLPEIAHRHAARVVELGVVRNHVHLIVELSPRPDIPRLVQGLKGASARIANRDGYMPRARLQWASGYDFRSIGIQDLARAIAYVRGQNRHHPELAIDETRLDGV